MKIINLKWFKFLLGLIISSKSYLDFEFLFLIDFNLIRFLC